MVITAKPTTSAIKVSKWPYSTFNAVFLPVFLTLMGVTLFLRLGWIAAVAGPFKTVLIITIATAISFITALSISSTATNTPIGSGGIYYMLSRTFGIEVGFSISLPLFIAQALGITFYVLGFSETLVTLFPSLSSSFISCVTLTTLTLIATLSPGAALKTQLVIFSLLLAAIISYFLGASIPFDPMSEAASMSAPQVPFWMLFGLFFPAVTGVENGLTFSKELKSPHKAIPLGFLIAIISSYIIYLLVALSLLIKIPKHLLIDHPLIMQDVSFIKYIVTLGILASTLSGALSSLLTAPKSLEALSHDNLLPKFISKTYGPYNAPIWAIFITFCLSLAATTIGDLNHIAPILSMFFLMSYAMLNAAVGLEAMIANPSWRPTLKTPWSLSLIGALLCTLVMLMISSGATIFAFSLVTLLFVIIKKRHISTNWDDIRHSIFLFFSRYAIYHLSSIKLSAKTWRPNLLVFIGDPHLRSRLIEITCSLTHKKGFLTLASILDEHNRVISYEFLEEQKLASYLRLSKIPALIKTYVAPSLSIGMKNLIMNFGIGPLTPNTIVLGATHKEDKTLIFAEVIKTSYMQKKNVILIRENDFKSLSIKPSNKRIDVWWGGGLKNNSDLMLVLGYMLQTSHEWKGSELTLKTVVSRKEDMTLTEDKLKTFAELGRLRITTQVELQTSHEDLFKTTIKKSSSNADLVFLGLRAPFEDETLEEYAEYYSLLIQKTEGFPTVAFVLAAEPLDFHKILV